MRDESAGSTGRRLRVALVGPTLPYRSGIAQYTSQLQAALAAKAEVQTYSFNHMYPSWLYPGKTDYKLTSDMRPDPAVRYSLNVNNPLSWRRTADTIAESVCDVAILDWWTLFWQPGFGYMTRRLQKRGVKVVYLCHNLFNHKTGGLMGAVDKIMSGLTVWILKQADGYIVQSSEKGQQLRALKPGAKVLFRLHPIYDRFPPPSRQLPKRGKLELFFFGLIRPYKGLDILLEALKRLNDPEIYLTIAGEPWGDTEALRHQMADLPNIEAHMEYVSDEDAANYFARADIVVAPYRSATGSGVVAVAYHYGKPVIATSVGGLKDAVKVNSTGWLVPPEDPAALAAAIAQVSRQQAQALRPNIEAFCRDNSWSAMASAIYEFMEELATTDGTKLPLGATSDTDIS